MEGRRINLGEGSSWMGYRSQLELQICWQQMRRRLANLAADIRGDFGVTTVGDRTKVVQKFEVHANEITARQSVKCRTGISTKYALPLGGAPVFGLCSNRTRVPPQHRSIQVLVPPIDAT